MKKINIILGISIALFAPFFASALSLSVQSLTPGSTVIAKSNVSLKVVSAFGNPVSYQISDSFGASSITADNINGGGNFSWLPGVTDVGTHTITITGTDFSSGSPDVGTITQTITVAPPPSIT